MNPLLGYWRQCWQTSALRAVALSYREAWLARPMRQTGLAVLAAVVVHAWMMRNRDVPWPQWGVDLLFAGWACVALRNTQDWHSLRADSRVVKWWELRRSHHVRNRRPD